MKISLLTVNFGLKPKIFLAMKELLFPNFCSSFHNKVHTVLLNKVQDEFYEESKQVLGVACHMMFGIVSQLWGYLL